MVYAPIQQQVAKSPAKGPLAYGVADLIKDVKKGKDFQDRQELKHKREENEVQEPPPKKNKVRRVKFLPDDEIEKV